MVERLPRWMRTFSYRNVEGEARAKRTARVVLLMALFTVSLLLSVLAAMRYPNAFHLPVFAACSLALTTMLAVRWQTDFRIVVLYLAVTVPVNSAITYMAVGASTYSPFLALAGVVLASGLAGLLIVARTKKKPSVPAKVAVMAFVVGMFAASGAFGQSEGTYEHARLWLFAAFFPMALLVVLTFVVLLAYHARAVTMPADRWV
jgi:hypothetical protein